MRRAVAAGFGEDRRSFVDGANCVGQAVADRA
jgi:hypothetical protein